MSRLLSVCLLALVGCSGNGPIPGAPGQGVPPTTAEEKAVAKHLAATANEPASLEFVQWGKNILKAEVAEGWTFRAIVRVRYRAKNAGGNQQHFDQIYVVMDDGRVVGAASAFGRAMSTDNPAGDLWRDTMVMGLQKPPK